MADIKDVKLGTTQVNKIYCGNDLVFEKIIDTTKPITTVYPDPTNPTLTHYSGTKVWLEVNEMCTTYYTLDGSTPTTASAIFREPFTFGATTTIKYFSVDVAGNVEAVKTTVFDITGAVTSITTISPSATAQNTIPFTVTLSNNQGNTMYYRIGTGVQQTYTAPFTVNQSLASVQGTQITVYYWSTGEAEKSITYNTSGAIVGKPVVTATVGSNQVTLSWAAVANATSYSVYRSTTLGTLGAVLAPSEYQTGTSYTDTTAVDGTTYYYTVKSMNYGSNQNSDQVTATPETVVLKWRYLKVEGYGALETDQNTTTRMVEVEAFVGTTNVLAGKTAISYQTIDTGSTDIKTITNGTKTGTSGTYPVWWLATPNANVVFDLGSSQPITKLAYYGYSINGVQRTNRFKIYGSNTNNGTDWFPIWDMSANTLVQGILPLGYEKTVQALPDKIPVRYVRNEIAGSTANIQNHWAELEIWRSGVNLALTATPQHHAAVTSSGYINDGVLGNVAFTSNNPNYAQFDLGQIYTDIDNIKIWHYFGSARSYHGNKVMVSTDNVSWVTIFNSDIDGEYTETSAGKVVEVPYE